MSVNVNKNKYKQATKHLGIPVPGWQDGIWPELEMMKWQMVENMLMASMKGSVNSIFREGDMRVIQDSNGTYTTTISATGNEPSIQGNVAGAYFDAPASFSWTGLQSGKSYFLYVKGSSDTFQNSNSVEAVSSTTRIKMRYVVLVAKVDLTGEKPTIDRHPSGKINTRDLAKHVVEFENPHGDKLTQDELLVRKHLAIGDGNDADLELDVNGEVTHIPVSRLVNTLKTTTKFVEFKTEEHGFTLTVDGKVLFANVVRIDPDQKGAGEVIVGFYGTHPDVKNQNQVIVWNSGDAGVSMRAMIVFE